MTPRRHRRIVEALAVVALAAAAFGAVLAVTWLL
jgi:hypothetical protein